MQLRGTPSEQVLCLGRRGLLQAPGRRVEAPAARAGALLAGAARGL